MLLHQPEAIISKMNKDKNNEDNNKDNEEDCKPSVQEKKHVDKASEDAYTSDSNQLVIKKAISSGNEHQEESSSSKEKENEDENVEIMITKTPTLTQVL